MLAAYTSLKNAQKVKKFLAQKRVLHPEYLPLKELGHIYFPLTKKLKVPSAKVVNTRLKFKSKPTKNTIQEILKSKLTKKQLSLIPRSQEVVGKIMILEVPEELEKKEKTIAQAYLTLNKHIETVVKKTKMHSGVYRTRKVKILAGKRTKETIHSENGVKIKLHLEKTYFSARSAHERLRIAKQVKKGEDVLVMFSGAAPFPLTIAKHANPRSLYAIEINPLAHQFALENLQINKFENKIKLFEGDVYNVLPTIRKKFDRIAMPLPKTGEEFLHLALRKIKPKGVIHLYAFLNEKDVSSYKKKIKDITKNKVRILRVVKCGQFSPGTFRMCFDLKTK